MTTQVDFGSYTPPQQGLVLGRFMPPSRIDQALCDFARSYCRHLSVVIHTRKTDSVSPAQRLERMKALCPGAAVYLLEIDEFASMLQAQKLLAWRAAMESCLPVVPDVLFSLDLQGNEIARQLGTKHVFVDLGQAGSSDSPEILTDITIDPIAMRQEFAARVKEQFIRRVVVCGPESTGKSRLCRDLAQHYNTQWVPEYIRSYLDNKQSQGLGLLCEPSDLPAIMHGQQAAENALSPHANRLLLLDTDGLQTLMYSHFYFGSCPDDLIAMAHQRPRDLHLLLDVDVPWIADPQRDMPHRRAEIFERMRRLLEDSRLPYIVIRGNWEKRMESACQAIDRLLSNNEDSPTSSDIGR